MNVNELNVHKSTPFLCLHNSFLKKLTLQYFSAAVRAVPSEEIGRGSFVIMSSLSLSLMLSLSEKATFEHCSAHLNNVEMCPLQKCSNLPHVQTRNITFCYNKGGIITVDIPIPQDKGHICI
jgi:hypothetical protein